MDRLTPEQRRRCMSAVRNKNTSPELIVRRYLFAKGFRYRLNSSKLPGHPDIVLRKNHTVIFVNGCFWHGHEGCRRATLPKTNVDFWREKIGINKKRDADILLELERMGWKCITIWQCQLESATRENTLSSLVENLKRTQPKSNIVGYIINDDTEMSMVAEE